MIKVIVFDFDGVLVDSNEIKRDAWKEVFENRQDVLPFLDGRLSRGSGTRFDILHDVFSKAGVRNEAERRRLVSEYAERYDDVVKKGVFGLQTRVDVQETLAELSERYALYINSATPDASLEVLTKGLKIAAFFRGIKGATSGSKEKNLQDVLKQESVGVGETVFVGDSEGDARAAKAEGVFFIGVSNSFNGWREREFPLLAKFSELPGLIKNLE